MANICRLRKSQHNVAGFAVQQFLEILTSVLNLDSNASFEKFKKVILGVVSIVLGLLLLEIIPSNQQVSSER
jgi:hypothetical protein